MLIQKIKVSNYKTYLDLDLDLSVDEERPIILIGGSNGGGKTTLFEAISGALYGLKIENAAQFHELLNQGAIDTAKQEIVFKSRLAAKFSVKSRNTFSNVLICSILQGNRTRVYIST